MAGWAPRAHPGVNGSKTLPALHPRLRTAVLGLATAVAVACGPQPKDMDAAVRSNREDLVEQYLQARPSLVEDPYVTGGGRGRGSSYQRSRPLYAAAEAGHIDMLRLLLARGADVHARIGSGATALHAAASEGHLDIVALLLERCASLQAVDDSGRTPLHMAANIAERDPKLVRFLLDRGAALDARDREGRTPLHAAGPGNVWVASLLCARGADPSVRDDAGKTLEDDAKESRDPLALPWVRAAEGCRGLLETFRREGAVSEEQRQLAVDLYECEADYKGACTRAGYAFDRGRGTASNPTRATLLYRKACDRGDMIGCSNLATSYANASGVPRDLARAVALYEKACNADVAAACVNLGFQLDQEPAGTRPFERISALYTKGCDLGSAVGCYNLALNVAAGEGVQKDADRARALLRKSCEAGYALACQRVPPT